MKDTVILVTRYGMGHSQLADLPLKLIEKYFNLLLQGNELPKVICFYTDGVKLTVIGSPVLRSTEGIGTQGSASHHLLHLPRSDGLGKERTGWYCRRHARYYRSADEGG